MILEEQANAVKQKLDSIQMVIWDITAICDLILSRRQIGGKTYQYTQEQKQDLIQQYQAEKAKLQTYVEELP